ncbi:MAG: flavodoxin [Oscillospiraceae bacterium]
MKKALIYYSVSGKTRFVAEAISRMTIVDLIEIKTPEVIKQNIFSRYIGGFKQMRNKDDVTLIPINFNLDEYDTIYIGTPTWNASPPPAVKEFFRQNQIAHKNVYLFSTYMGRGGMKCLDSLSDMLGDNTIKSKTAFINSKGMKLDSFKKKILKLLNIE